jgi:hypothetical protein
MLIYEVTLPSEYIGGLAKKAGTGLVQAGKKAAGAVANSTAAKDLGKIGSAVASKSALSNIGKGFVQGFTGVNFPQQTPQNPLDKATRDQARQLAQQWEKQVRNQKKPAPSAKSVATDPNWRQDALKSTGAAFGQSPAQRPAPGQMPASVASSAQGQRMMQAYGQPRGGIQGIKEAPQEYTTPGGIVVPGGTTTDPGSSGMVDFEKWADQQLTTQVSGTQQPIDLDAVKKDPEVKADLDKVIPQIKKDPTNIAAVEMYFLTAMRGMQRMAAQARQNAGIDPNVVKATTNPLSKIINDQQLTAIKNLVQNPQTTAAIKQVLGIK